MAQVSAPRFDAIVVGGSYAGLSAALQLARARRSVLIVDAGQPRNRQASLAHGWLGRDGVSGAAILDEARAQLRRYATLSWQADEAVTATRTSAGGPFRMTCRSGAAYAAQRLVLAFGVRDVLPALEGVRERWGQSVFSCPYCHGYELQRGHIGLLCTRFEDAEDQAVLLSEWGSVTLFLTAPQASPAPALVARLGARGVQMEHTPVQRLTATATVELRDGRQVPTDGLFVHHDTVLSSPLAVQLGCSLEDGGCITTDSAKQTTVEGVFACGDIARMAGSIALAVGEGALAGVAVHHSLMGQL